MTQAYALSLEQDPKLYTATSVLFFAIMNAVKLIPYFALGELDTDNLKAAATLMPIAILATFAVAAIVKRVRSEIFYPITYTLIFLLSLNLIWDGVAGVF